MGSLIQTALSGKASQAVPFWFMRQAGRYLPEYREVRAQAGGFLKLCYTPALAAEVTLQPLRRFNMDAAIIFSDILVIPHAMGMDVRFEEGEGPVMTKLRDRQSIESLSDDIDSHVAPVMEALRKVRAELAADKSLIGFCGAPWTVACYMVQGHGKSNYDDVRRFALEQREAFALLIERLVKTSIAYLSQKIEAGADVIQIFDSWAGILSETEFNSWVIEPTRAIVAGVKKKHPVIPIIGFARGAGAKLIAYAEKTGVSCIGIDTQTPMSWARQNLRQTLQGNLDPIVLATSRAEAVTQTRHILETAAGTPFIFNLGHGIIPSTPLENVQAVCDTIREHSVRKAAAG